MFREGTCPKCGKQIQVPDDQEKILCMYWIFWMTTMMFRLYIITGMNKSNV